MHSKVKSITGAGFGDCKCPNLYFDCYIYSFNIKDFCQLQSNFMGDNRNHAGIILAPQRQYSIGQQLRGLLRLSAEKPAEDMINQLIFINTYIN